MWRRRRGSETDPWGEILAEECESFLAGEYVERCEARGEPVPLWACLNVLAQGTEAEIRAAAADPRHDPGHQALAYVAGELVDLVDEGCLDLETFQHEVLVPLELDVVSCPALTGGSAEELASGLLTLLP